MSSSVILSIHPEYSRKILAGKKTWEFRKRIWNDENVSMIYIYETAPTSAIVGVIKDFEIFRDRPWKLYDEAGQGSGIDFDEFDDYFENVEIGYGIQIYSVVGFFEPIALSDFGISKPPQNFCYILSTTERMHV